MSRQLVRLLAFQTFYTVIDNKFQQFTGGGIIHNTVVSDISVFDAAIAANYARILSSEAHPADVKQAEAITNVAKDEVIETSDEDIAEVVVEVPKAKKTPVFTSCPICGKRKSNSKEFCKKCLAKKEEENKEI